MSNLFLIIYGLVLFAILGLLYYTGKRHRVARAVAIAAVAILIAIIGNSFEAYKGWPSTDSPGDHGNILWVDVVVPTVNENGEIYLWINPTGSSNLINYWVDNAPRVYSVPYTSESARNFIDIKDKLKKGFVVKFKKDVVPVGKNGTGGGIGNGQSTGNSGRFSDGRDNYSLTTQSPDELLTK